MRKSVFIFLFISSFLFSAYNPVIIETPVLNGRWGIIKNEVISRTGEKGVPTIFTTQFEKSVLLEFKSNHFVLLFQNGDSLELHAARLEFAGNLVRVYVEGGKPGNGGNAEAYTEFEYTLEGDGLLLRKETPNYSTVIELSRQSE